LETPAVRQALERAVELGERGVQVAAYLGDELIVDAWIGDEVDGETLFPVFSVSKAVTALALHVQAERGLIDYDAPLARYWPEYGTRGKEAVTVRQVLMHRAGVPQLPPETTPERLGDWEWMTGRLAEVEPLYEPGTVNAYHSVSFGWLLGEVVCRTDPRRRPFAEFVREELCEPLGVDAFWFGIPAQLEGSVATLTFPDPPPAPPAGAPPLVAVPPGVQLVPEVFNRPDVQRGVVPAVGGIANARSVARLFGLLASGGELAGTRLLSEERIRGFLEPRPDFDGDDLTYGRRLPVGAGGFWIEAPGVTPDGGLGHVLSHPGAGGAVGWADLDSGLAVAICHDRMFAVVPEHPFAAIGDAVRDAAASVVA
jgi:CubicO group peptidase (beta-lactamase class C family)